QPAQRPQPQRCAGTDRARPERAPGYRRARGVQWRPGTVRTRLRAASRGAALGGEPGSGPAAVDHLTGYPAGPEQWCRARRHLRRPGLYRLGGRAAGPGAGRQRVAERPCRLPHPLRAGTRTAPGRGSAPTGRGSQPADQPGRTRLMASPIQRVLGFDFGTRQIGVAVGQTLTGNARPLKELRARDGIPDWDQIGALLKEWQPDALIVGLPLNMDGSPSEMSARA